MPGAKLTAIRLTEQDQAAATAIVELGYAQNTSDAIRFALRFASRTLYRADLPSALYVLGEAADAASAIRGRGSERIESAEAGPRLGDFLRESAGRLNQRALERIDTKHLEQMASGPNAKVAAMAKRELERRGLFFDGLGHWVENRPQMTVRVPSAPIKKGPPGRARG